MINMAVISLRDIMKYLIKLTIAIALVLGMIKYFSNTKTKVGKLETFQTDTFLSCLDTSVPGIASLNQEEEKANVSLEPLKLALGIELGMITSVSKEDNNTVIASNKEEKQEEAEKEKSQEVEKAQTGLKTEVQSNNVPNKYTLQYNGVKVKNETDYKITTEMLKPDIEIKNENIIIYHTHSCESYTSSEKYTYKPTGNFRTTDINYSVVRVGKELKNQLTSYGYKVIHSEKLHDYPSYSGSYSNSLKTVSKLLEENKNTDVVIDLHRDAIRR